MNARTAFFVSVAASVVAAFVIDAIRERQRQNVHA